MQTIHSNIAMCMSLSLLNCAVSTSNESRDSFVYILEAANIRFRLKEGFIETEKFNCASFCTIYLSVIRIQITELLENVIPLLAHQDCAFRIPETFTKAGDILDGNGIPGSLGKIVTVPTNSSNEAYAILNAILPIARNYKSPKLPGCIHVEGAIHISWVQLEQGQPMHATPIGKMFNSLANLNVNINTKKLEALDHTADTSRGMWLNDRYLLIRVLNDQPKGRVFKALMFQQSRLPKFVIIKEGKEYMISDIYGRDMGDRMKDQYSLLQQLQEIANVGVVIDLFVENGNLYMVQKLIKGSTLLEIRNKLNKKRTLWCSLPNSVKRRTIDYCIKAICELNKIHSSGVIHRDFTPANIIVSWRSKVYLIDFELSYLLVQDNPTPPYLYGSLGFMSPEQSCGCVPTVKEDVFSASSTIFFIITGILPKSLLDKSDQFIKDLIILHTRDEPIANLILRCRTQPEQRPDLEEVISELKTYKQRI